MAKRGVEDSGAEAGKVVHPRRRKVRRGAKRAADYRPSKQQRELVRTLAALGFKPGEISAVTLHPKTGRPVPARMIARLFEAEIRTAPILADAKALGTLLKAASRETADRNAVAAATAWLKVRGYTVDRLRIEVDPETGVIM